MTEEKKLRLSYGTFELVGNITVVPNETFQTDLKGKNTPTYNYSRINMKMEDDNGGTFYLNVIDGFDTVNPFPIYANIKDSETNEQMQVAFADRHNPDILSHIDNRSFIGVALQKKENEEGKKVFDYKNFLALYDVINFIKDRFETGMKIRVVGKTRYGIYNDSINKEFQVSAIQLLSEEDKYESGFKFSQDVIIQDGDVDMSEWDEKLIAKVKAKVMTKIKKQYKLLNLPLIVRATEEDKEKRKKVIEKFLTVEEGKVRRIRLQGKYNTGYVSGQVQEADLPEEAQELIELGLYEKEEVMRMYAKGDKVDEMLVNRPVVFQKKGETPKIDMADDQYTVEEIEAVKADAPWEKEEVIEDSNDDDLSFLDELD